MLPLLLTLACARNTAPEAAVPAAEPLAQVDAGVRSLPAGGATNPQVGDYYDPVPAAVADCNIDADNQVGWLVQLTCPGDRVITDMRGVGVPAPDQALETVMRTLDGLGLAARPRQATVPLPGTQAVAQVVDGQGQGLATTTWVVHHMGTMPQALTCMTLQDDAQAEAWCLSTLAELLLPPGPVLGERPLQRAEEQEE